ncbi:hypothetical protein [Actinomadura viridis]|uniref:Uncharacterized protein n=1 Tax=Actinomadura viridis TaxID=58110 RepID=A0A931DF90_9ACTN|nr:hypothetical protein [Actinomadura viridis]MBG6087222.1 hypothetical protein [Actinomadura viridis]
MEQMQTAYAWLGARYSLTKERMKEDRGEGPISYIAVILLIAVIAGAFVSSGIGTDIVNFIKQAITKVFQKGGGST